MANSAHLLDEPSSRTHNTTLLSALGARPQLAVQIDSRIPLAIQEREKWIQLLRAFDLKAYPSKAQQFVPSFPGILDITACDPGKALDAGCGSGLLGRILKNRGWTVEGIDILPEAVDMASAHFPARTGDIQNLPWPDSSFDLALCSMVLMLTHDAFRPLAEMRRVLRPGGWVLIALLNPAYEGVERTRGARTQSPPLDLWQFQTGGNHYLVHYYSREMEVYLANARRLLACPHLYCVDDNGRLVDVPSSSDLSPHSEYVWIIGQTKP